MSLRVVALLGPRADEALVKQFELPNVNLFTGNDMDPSDRPSAAIVFGGDGTIHRHLPALIESRTPFLHVPLGGGNDFPHSLGISSVQFALDAWKRFVSTGSNVREIDAGTITELRPEISASGTSDDAWTRELEASQLDPANHLAVLGPKIMESQLRHAIEARDHLAALPNFFCCVAGVGFDAETNRRANRLHAFWRRHGGYILAAASGLFSYKSVQTTVSLPAPKWAPTDDGWVAKLDEPALLCAIGNAPAYGGGLRLTAKAEMDDAKLDICFVRHMSPFTVLRLFSSVFSGSHLKLAQVEYFQADRVRVSTANPRPIYADGEYICDTPAEFAILPRALRAIVPNTNR